MEPSTFLTDIVDRGFIHCGVVGRSGERGGGVVAAFWPLHFPPQQGVLLMKKTVTLEQEQWNQLLQILSTAPLPWTMTNPLILTISGQTLGVRPDGLVLNSGVQPEGTQS